MIDSSSQVKTASNVGFPQISNSKNQFIQILTKPLKKCKVQFQESLNVLTCK